MWLCLFTELKNSSDLLALSGKTLCVTSGARPAEKNSSDSLLCPYINLQLINACPAGTSPLFISFSFVISHAAAQSVHSNKDKSLRTAMARFPFLWVFYFLFFTSIQILKSLLLNPKSTWWQVANKRIDNKQNPWVEQHFTCMQDRGCVWGQSSVFLIMWL